MKKKGFTLVELLAVIALLAILVILALPRIISYLRKAKEDAFSIECKEIIDTAKKQWFGLYANDPREKVYSRCRDGSCSVVLDMSMRDALEYYVYVNQFGKVERVYITDGIHQFIEDNGELLNSITSENATVLSDEVQKVEDLNEHEVIHIKNNIVTVNDQDITSPNTDAKYKCKRATTLHTETCTQTKDFCKGAGYTATGKMKTNIVSYGNLGTRGKLAPGDAFDCDVNGDGEYNSTNERFYFVNYYFDTKELKYNNDYVVLLYYSNVSNGVPSNAHEPYDLTNENHHGPQTAASHLPTTSQWKNVKLKETNRQMLAEEKGNHNKKKTVYGDELPVFSYAGKAARLITAKEIFDNCGVYQQTGNAKIDELADCIFLFESTKFADNTNIAYGSWTETPRYGKGSNNTRDINTVTATYRNWNFYRANNEVHDKQKQATKPAIDVKISDIEF